MNIYGVWPSLKVARNADGPTLAESGFNLEIASWVRVNSSTWPQMHLPFLSCPCPKVDDTGRTWQFTSIIILLHLHLVNSDSDLWTNESITSLYCKENYDYGKHMENDEWLWLTSDGMATCCDEPLAMSSSLINMFPSIYSVTEEIGTVGWSGKISNKN